MMRPKPLFQRPPSRGEVTGNGNSLRMKGIIEMSGGGNSTPLATLKIK